MPANETQSCYNCYRIRRHKAHGLCTACYLNDSIRVRFISVKGKSEPIKKPKVIDRTCFKSSDIVIKGHHPLPLPTPYLPGTPEKIAVLEDRAAKGQALYHILDQGVLGKEWNRYDVPLIPNSIDRMVSNRPPTSLWQMIRMEGRRVKYQSSWTPGHGPMPGDYWKTEFGIWGALCPSGHECNLDKRKIEEHEDGTITVTPSIVVYSCGEASISGDCYIEHWHGYLTRGVWKAV